MVYAKQYNYAYLVDLEFKHVELDHLAKLARAVEDIEIRQISSRGLTRRH